MKLKTLYVIALITFVMLSVSASAQIKPYDGTVTTGESALSYGIDISGSFANPDFSTILFVKYNNGMGQATYVKKISTGTFFGPSLGVKDNAMWFAPFLSFDLFGFIKLTSWNGIFFGKPDHPAWDINYAFSYHAIDFDLDKIGLKGFCVGYSLLHYFQDRPLNLPFIKYEWKFSKSKKDGIIFSYTKNIQRKSPMFLVGYHRKF